MARIEFTRQLTRHVDCPPPADVPAGDLKAALDAVFTTHPQLRGYVLDDQGSVRKHVAIFVDNELLRRSGDLTEVTLKPDSQVFVMQALSGG